MKQRQSFFPNFFSEEEIAISDVLIDLPNLIFQCKSSFAWGTKRRRSALDPSPSLSSSPSPSLHWIQADNGKTEITTKFSPSTPLDFSPIKSDHKSKHPPKRNSKKTANLQTRDELSEMIDELSQRGELLKRETEAARSYYNDLKALNVELKAKKQQLSSGLKREKPHLEMGRSLNVGLKVDLRYQIPIFPHQQQHFIMDQTPHESLTKGRFQYPYGQMAPFLSSNNNIAKAAEARKRRMMKMREMKNSFAAIKLQRCT